MNGDNSAAILTKARAMYGKRIKAEEYDRMIACKTVSEVAGFLKTKTHYAQALSGISENTVHRGQLENLIKRSSFESYGRLYKYTNVSKRGLLRAVIVEEEIAEILRMVLLLKAENSGSFILDLPGYLINRATVDLLSVARATSFDELIEALRGSEYAAILKRFRPEESDDTSINYIACEHAFYEHYYKDIFESLKKIKSKDEREELKKILELEIEMLNLNHIYRSVTYLSHSKADVVNSLYPYYSHLSIKQLEKMFNSTEDIPLQTLISQTPYARQFNNEEHPYIEDYTDRILYSCGRKSIHFTTHSSVAFYAYAIINKIELMNITNIIEGIRYQVSEDEIKKIIIT